MKSPCTIRAFLCPHLHSFSTFRISWSAVINSPTFCRNCKPIHALLQVLPYTWLVLFLFSLQTSQLGLSDNEWTQCGFLLVGNRRKFLIMKLFFDDFMRRVTSSCWSWCRCISFFQSICKWFNRSNMVSSTSFLPLKKFPLADENPTDGTAFCVVTPFTWTKFAILHSITLLPLW